MFVLDTKTLIQFTSIGVFTVVALATDLKMRKIPNVLTVPSLVLAFAFQIGFGGLAGFKSALAGFGLGFGTLFVLWLIGGGGAGDVKLMGALGAWLGGMMTFYVIVFSTVFVALGSVLILSMEWIMRGWRFTRRRYLGRFDGDRAKEEKLDTTTAIQRWRDRRRIMPYALPVGLATWLILAWSLLDKKM